MKLRSLAQAIDLINDGDTVYLAGFTHLIPFAVGHEIIRQKKRHLTLARATPDLVYDQMIAAGCAKKVIFSWAGNPGVGLLRALRRAIERGELEIEEYTHYQMVSRLAAGASNLPFWPLLSGQGTDLPKVNLNIKTIENPFAENSKDRNLINVVPALNPDVTVVHVQRCDEFGNAHIWGILGEQKEAAFAAKKLIITAEEIVDTSVIRSDPNRVLIPGFKVEAVVHLPWCAHPSYAQGYYDRDNDFYLQWDNLSADENKLQEWLDEWILSTKDHNEYLVKLGEKKLNSLKISQNLAAPVNYGAYEVIK